MADDGDLRAKLVGSWQSETAGKEASNWSLQRSADAVHISTSNGAKTLAEYECKMGQECDIKDAGHHAKVTIYFNGPKLVETETMGLARGEGKFLVTGDGDQMELEVIPIEPEGKTETVVFKRVKQ